MSGLDVVPHQVGPGATVLGVELSKATDDQAAAIDQAWAEHGLLVFRDQDFTPDDHLRFAKQMGPVDVNRYFDASTTHPEIALVRKEPTDELPIGGAWHTDHSYDVAPARGSILVARELPTSGGDTLFVDSGAAWEALSEGLRETLRSMRAVHTNAHAFNAEILVEQKFEGRIHPAPTVTTTHPVAIAHPVTGRELLYVNPGFTVAFDGWTEAESQPLLEYLFVVGADEAATYRLEWAPGTVAMWDNRSTWHMAVNDYPGQRRIMHRTTIAGVPLAAAG